MEEGSGRRKYDRQRVESYRKSAIFLICNGSQFGGEVEIQAPQNPFHQARKSMRSTGRIYVAGKPRFILLILKNNYQDPCCLTPSSRT
jgi:hypothetical protein